MGPSGCLEPSPTVHVELIGWENAGCPVPGGSEASMRISVTQLTLGPAQSAHPVGADHATVCPHLLSCPLWGGRCGMCCTRVPATPDLSASGRASVTISHFSHALVLGIFEILLPSLKNAWKFTSTCSFSKDAVLDLIPVMTLSLGRALPQKIGTLFLKERRMCYAQPFFQPDN